jgi:hypothetical protein
MGDLGGLGLGQLAGLRMSILGCALNSISRLLCVLLVCPAHAHSSSPQRSDRANHHLRATQLPSHCAWFALQGWQHCQRSSRRWKHAQPQVPQQTQRSSKQ